MVIISYTIIAAGIYLAVNLFSFIMFAYDKRKALKNSWRTSENTLLFFAFLGPFGAFAAMKITRHKTKKKKILPVYLFILLHLTIWGLIMTGNL